MRHPPEDPLIAANQVAADVVQARRLAADHVKSIGLRMIERIQRRMNLDVIEQRRAAMRHAFSIDRRARDGNRARGILGGQQQNEGE